MMMNARCSNLNSPVVNNESTNVRIREYAEIHGILRQEERKKRKKIQKKKEYIHTDANMQKAYVRCVRFWHTAFKSGWRANTHKHDLEIVRIIMAIKMQLCAPLVFEAIQYLSYKCLHLHEHIWISEDWVAFRAVLSPNTSTSLTFFCASSDDSIVYLRY